jgi:hypothetical protein
MLLGACGADDRAPASGAPGRADSAGVAPSGGEAPPGSRGAPAALRDPVPVKVSAEIGGRTAAYTGQGECTHTADASIYEVPAAQWAAHVADDGGDLRYLNLTLWQPKGASAIQVSMALQVGDRSSEIATVAGAPTKGSGTGQASAAGAGGTLRVEGKDAEGSSVHLTVECERWTEPVAEGG